MVKTNQLTPRGRTFVGTIIKAKAQQTATLEFERKKFIPKYERYLIARTKLTVHNPTNINAKKGDIVKVQECRPISKTKSFVILEVVGKDRRFLEADDFQQRIQKPQEKVESKEQ